MGKGKAVGGGKERKEGTEKTGPGWARHLVSRDTEQPRPDLILVHPISIVLVWESDVPCFSPMFLMFARIDVLYVYVLPIDPQFRSSHHSLAFHLLIELLFG